jgi:hypothetical protein
VTNERDAEGLPGLEAAADADAERVQLVDTRVARALLARLAKPNAQPGATVFRRHVRVTNCLRGGKVSSCCSCHHCALYVCGVCGAYEGGLTTHCPGERVDFDTTEAVYRTDLDFTTPRGWHRAGTPGPPRHAIFEKPEEREPARVPTRDPGPRTFVTEQWFMDDRDFGAVIYAGSDPGYAVSGAVLSDSPGVVVRISIWRDGTCAERWERRVEPPRFMFRRFTRELDAESPMLQALAGPWEGPNYNLSAAELKVELARQLDVTAHRLVVRPLHPNDLENARDPGMHRGPCEDLDGSGACKGCGRWLGDDDADNAEPTTSFEKPQ